MDECEERLRFKDISWYTQQAWIKFEKITPFFWVKVRHVLTNSRGTKSMLAGLREKCKTMGQIG